MLSTLYALFLAREQALEIFASNDLYSSFVSLLVERICKAISIPRSY